MVFGTDELKEYILERVNSLEYFSDFERWGRGFKEKTGKDYCIVLTSDKYYAYLITESLIMNFTLYGIEINKFVGKAEPIGRFINDFAENINGSTEESAINIKDGFIKIINLLTLMKCTPNRAITMLRKSFEDNGLEMNQDLEDNFTKLFKMCFPDNYSEYYVQY